METALKLLLDKGPLTSADQVKALLAASRRKCRTNRYPRSISRATTRYLNWQKGWRHERPATSRRPTLPMLLRQLELQSFEQHQEELGRKAERDGWRHLDYLRHLAEWSSASGAGVVSSDC